MSNSEANILIVEDDAVTSKVLSSALGLVGDCKVTDNGEEALEIAFSAIEKNKPFDLICLDINLPGLSGRDVLKTLRAFESKKGFSLKESSLVIMITANTDKESILGSFGEGCEAYIEKPIDIEKLRDVLRKNDLL